MYDDSFDSQSVKAKNLLNEAISHPALHHKYLGFIVDQGFSYPSILKDFAVQYGIYGEVFRYGLNRLTSILTDRRHREMLIENLGEEEGALSKEDRVVLSSKGIDPGWIVGIPHGELYSRFKQTLNVETDERGISKASRNWKDNFIAWIDAANQYELLGALGVGTECVVPHVYEFIVIGLKKHTSLKLQDYVFFELHREIDDKHGLVMLAITDDLIADHIGASDEIRRGMMFALECRLRFWDDMLERAKVNFRCDFNIKNES